MPDIAGNAGTTASIGVGASLTNILEALGDHDWFRLTLTAGQTVSITLNSSGTSPLEDPLLRIIAPDGTTVLRSNDDSNGTRNSEILFTAATSGTYYIDAAAWDGRYAGTYQLSVQPALAPPPPPLWTNDQIATQLVSGYWGGLSRHFSVAQGGTISVNIVNLTPEGQFFARSALDLWSDILGIRFVEVASGANIEFDDDETGAWSRSTVSGQIIRYSEVNVETSWITRDGTNLDSYSLQTYIHEIGHALGLGHAGDYNSTADYAGDALYANDAWSTTIMSYFSQRENAYFADQEFSYQFAMSPMIADIVAMSRLYGLSTTTRTGDTTYGFNFNAGRSIYNASAFGTPAYTIFDNGGVDTLDYSGFSQSQRINLNSETFSNIGGLIGNVSIARGTLIENAVGGSGADTIIGNGANNVLTGRGGADTLTGGEGGDSFRDTISGLNGDTIVDFGAGDRIVITDASLSTFSFSLSGNRLTFSGGNLTFGSAIGGVLGVSSAAGGGVQLMLANAQTALNIRNDFNGDGLGDILWRDSGTFSQWLGQANGSFAWNPSAVYQVPGSWTLEETGDFNGDGRDDILWRDSGGTLSQWLGETNGSFAWNPSAIYQVPGSWTLEETGDFNSDGRDDILWRDGSGTLSQWLGQANGSFAWNPAAVYQTPAGWDLAQVGDFNGDGRDDILWRDGSGTLSQWLGQANGSFAWNPPAIYQVPGSWTLEETGDFNGDGRDDILWRDASGTLSQWLGQANGSFAWNPAAVYQTPAGWDLAQVGDFNGDGRDDILWRDGSGTLSEWLGQANGSFAWNPAAVYQVPASWQLQPVDIL